MLNRYPEGLHPPQPLRPVHQAIRCCESDAIMGWLRYLPFFIEARPPHNGPVHFRMQFVRWEYLGPSGATISSAIRLTSMKPVILPGHYAITTLPGQTVDGRIELSDDVFAFEPTAGGLRLEIVTNPHCSAADAPLRRASGEPDRQYRRLSTRPPSAVGATRS
jgi:hypothetical protein